MPEDEILTELRLIRKLLLAQLIEAGAQGSQRDRILRLANIGLEPKEIAEALNTTANTVSVTLSRERRRGMPKENSDA